MTPPTIDVPARQPPVTRFRLVLEAKPGRAGIHALRALLKALLRRHGLKCVDARELSSTSPTEADND